MPPKDTTTWIAAEVRTDSQTFWAMRGNDQLSSLRHPHAETSEFDLRAGYNAICAQLGLNEAVPIMISGLPNAGHSAVPCNPAQIAPTPLDATTLNLPPDTPVLGLLGMTVPQTGATMHEPLARLIGFLDLNPEFDGVLCLPGRSTHWALISAGEAVSFQSFLTPHLVKSSISLLTGADMDAWDDAALRDALADTISRPELMAARIAEAVAQALTEPQDANLACGRIWGALLGAELAGARSYWLGQNLALIADDTLSRPYATALEAQFALVTIADASRMALAGICATRKQLIKDTRGN